MKMQHRKFRELEAAQNDKASQLEIKIHDREQEFTALIERHEQNIRSLEQEIQDSLADLEKEKESHGQTNQRLIKSRNEYEVMSKKKEKYQHNFVKTEK